MRKDRVGQIKRLVDGDFPLAGKIIPVTDNLNTHNVGALYETFPAEEAGRLRDKLEVHYTPKHGSWLNMAEIELNQQSRAVSADTRDRTDEERGGGMEPETNGQACKINWRFTTADARVKLKRLYLQFG
jgi:hypothetical protein